VCCEDLPLGSSMMFVRYNNAKETSTRALCLSSRNIIFLALIFFPFFALPSMWTRARPKGLGRGGQAQSQAPVQATGLPSPSPLSPGAPARDPPGGGGGAGSAPGATPPSVSESPTTEELDVDALTELVEAAIRESEESIAAAESAQQETRKTETGGVSAASDPPPAAAVREDEPRPAAAPGPSSDRPAPKKPAAQRPPSGLDRAGAPGSRPPETGPARDSATYINTLGVRTDRRFDPTRQSVARLQNKRIVEQIVRSRVFDAGESEPEHPSDEPVSLPKANEELTDLPEDSPAVVVESYSSSSDDSFSSSSDDESDQPGGWTEGAILPSRRHHRKSSAPLAGSASRAARRSRGLSLRKESHLIDLPTEPAVMTLSGHVLKESSFPQPKSCAACALFIFYGLTSSSAVPGDASASSGVGLPGEDDGLLSTPVLIGAALPEIGMDDTPSKRRSAKLEQSGFVCALCGACSHRHCASKLPPCSTSETNDSGASSVLKSATGVVAAELVGTGNLRTMRAGTTVSPAIQKVHDMRADVQRDHQAQLSSALEQPAVVGWLSKLGTVHKSWKKRWFTLTKGGTLYYFTARYATVCFGFFVVRDLFSDLVHFQHRSKANFECHRKN
jgi:hypothetical protein